MFRINYLPPEQMPPHQRDFPRREQIEELPGAAGSRALAPMVAWYLVAMFAGILLLGYLTAGPPHTISAGTLATDQVGEPWNASITKSLY